MQRCIGMRAVWQWVLVVAAMALFALPVQAALNWIGYGCKFSTTDQTNHFWSLTNLGVQTDLGSLGSIDTVGLVCTTNLVVSVSWNGDVYTWGYTDPKNNIPPVYAGSVSSAIPSGGEVVGLAYYSSKYFFITQVNDGTNTNLNYFTLTTSGSVTGITLQANCGTQRPLLSFGGDGSTSFYAGSTNASTNTIYSVNKTSGAFQGFVTGGSGNSSICDCLMTLSGSPYSIGVLLGYLWEDVNGYIPAPGPIEVRNVNSYSCFYMLQN